MYPLTTSTTELFTQQTLTLTLHASTVRKNSAGRYSLVLGARVLGYAGDVLRLEELRVALSDQDLERLRRRFLRRDGGDVLRRHADLVLLVDREGLVAPRPHHSALRVHLKPVLSPCKTKSVGVSGQKTSLAEGVVVVTG